MSLRRVHWTVRCGMFLAPPYLQQKEWNRCDARDGSQCGHHCPTSTHTWNGGLHPALHHGVTPWPSSIVHSAPPPWVNCAWPSNLCSTRTEHCSLLLLKHLTLWPRSLHCLCSRQYPRLQLSRRHIPRQAFWWDSVKHLHVGWADAFRNSHVHHPWACLVQFACLVLDRHLGTLINSDAR